MFNFGKLLGAGFILTSLGLSAISGLTSYSGLPLMLPGITGIGYAGFVIAVTLVLLSAAVGHDLSAREWGRFGGVAIFCVVVALIDANTNIRALQSQVENTSQSVADRNAAYDTAVSELERIKPLIETAQADLLVMRSTDKAGISKAQELLNIPADGKKGPITRKAMAERVTILEERLAGLYKMQDSHSVTVASGKTVAESPFTAGQAVLYGIVLTMLSIVLSFIGGIYMDDDSSEEDEALAEEESAVIFAQERFSRLHDLLEKRRTA